MVIFQILLRTQILRAEHFERSADILAVMRDYLRCASHCTFNRFWKFKKYVFNWFFDVDTAPRHGEAGRVTA